jgi:hypothetical protein
VNCSRVLAGAGRSGKSDRRDAPRMFPRTSAKPAR